MDFYINHPVLFLIAGAVILLVLAQSVFFLVRALLRARELGMDRQVLRKTVVSAAIFTIAPAVSILVGVLALAKSLGVALPWLRLSVIGSLSYETIAAETTQTHLPAGAADASGYVTVLFVTEQFSMAFFPPPPALPKRPPTQALPKTAESTTCTF